MKRSKAVALTLMGASAIALQACEEERVEAQVFRDLQGCIDAQELTARPSRAGGWADEHDGHHGDR